MRPSDSKYVFLILIILKALKLITDLILHLISYFYELLIRFLFIKFLCDSEFNWYYRYIEP